MKSPRALLGAIAVAALGAGPAAATTVYGNALDGTVSQPFGQSIYNTFGETFTLSSAATLTSFSFWAGAGNAGNLELVVASWNGIDTSGPALYVSPVDAYAGGQQTLAFSAINTTLAAGSYVAFITTAGVSGPASNVILGSSVTDGGLGGQFIYNLSGATSVGGISGGWTAYPAFDAHLQYTASFETPVPLPAAGWLLVSGLGGLGLVGRRRAILHRPA